MLARASLSSAERLFASVSKATWPPPAEIEERPASPSTGAPAGPLAREIKIRSSLAASAGAASSPVAAAASAMISTRGGFIIRLAQVGGGQGGRA